MVIEIHNDQIKRYGGSAAIRNLGEPQSAIAQPSASFSGQWLHGDIFMMAAAYAFHICGDRPTSRGTPHIFVRMQPGSENQSKWRIGAEAEDSC